MSKDSLEAAKVCGLAIGALADAIDAGRWGLAHRLLLLLELATTGACPDPESAFHNRPGEERFDVAKARH